MLSHCFFPTIRYPTRITSTTSTLIDNIFTNVHDLEYNAVIIYNDISDHLPVLLCSKVDLLHNSSKSTPVKVRTFDNGSITAFCTSLGNVDWAPIYAAAHVGEHPNIVYGSFANIYNNMFETSFPLGTSRLNRKNTPRQPWITKSLVKSCNKKAAMYKKFCKKRTPLLENAYKLYRNKLKILIAQAKKDYFSNKFRDASGDSSKTWKIINIVLNKNKHCRFQILL